MWPGGGAWQLQTLWEHYLFDPSNTTFVKRIYPLFAGASQFFLETLQPFVNNTGKNPLSILSSTHISH
jgi:hypothetical protein